jgi:hypothetical protein
MDPISFGVINGLLGATLTGQNVKKEAEKKAADEKAATLKSGMEILTTSLNSSPEASFNFMNNRAMFPIFQSMDPYRQASILNTAGRSFETATQKSWIDAGKTDPTIARNLLGDIRLLEQPDFQAIIPLLVGYASPTFGKQELEILKEVGGDYNKAQPILQSGMFPKGSPVYAALSGIQKPDAAYTPVTNDTYKLIDDTFKEGKGTDALALIAGIEKTILPYTKTNNVAQRDHLKLVTYRNSYGTQEGKPDKLVKFLDNVLDDINAINDKDARQAAAVTNIPIVKELADGLPVSQWTEEERSRMAQLVAMAGVANDTDKNRTVYTNEAGKDVFSLQTPKSLMEDPDGWLDTLNRYSTENITAAYQAMSSGQKQVFQKDVETAIIRDHDERSRTTLNQNGTATTPSPVQYANRIKSVYDALPFVAGLVHDKLNIPRPGGTIDGLPTLPAQIANDGETPLDPTQIRVSPNRVLSASQDLISFAEAQGTTPQKLLSTDTGYYNLVDVGSDEPFKLYTPVNIIKQNAIFANKVDQNISDSAIKSVAFTLARTGVYNRSQQLDIIAANLSGEIPKRYRPNDMEATVTAEKFSGFVREATGRDIKLADISKAKDNANSFANLLKRADDRLNRMGPQSRAADNITSTLLNIFSLEGNLIETGAKGAKRIWKRINSSAVSDLVKVDDMRNDISGSATSNRAGIQDQINSFLDSNYARADAEMASIAVTLAYGYAKTMDPSGRISERDFAAAMSAVLGDVLAPRKLQLSIIDDLLEQTYDNLALTDRMFGFVSRVKSGDNAFQPTKDEVRSMRSLRYLDPLIRNTQQIDIVEQYQTNLVDPDGGFDSPLFNGKYAVNVSSPVKIFGEDIALNNNIVEIRVRQRTGEPKRIMGGLFVESGSGRIFSSMEIQQFKNQARGGI